jgi:hypothetical protein
MGIPFPPRDASLAVPRKKPIFLLPILGSIDITL